MWAYQIWAQWELSRSWGAFAWLLKQICLDCFLFMEWFTTPYFCFSFPYRYPSFLNTMKKTKFSRKLTEMAYQIWALVGAHQIMTAPSQDLNSETDLPGFRSTKSVRFIFFHYLNLINMIFSRKHFWAQMELARTI